MRYTCVNLFRSILYSCLGLGFLMDVSHTLVLYFRTFSIGLLILLCGSLKDSVHQAYMLLICGSPPNQLPLKKSIDFLSFRELSRWPECFALNQHRVIP